MSALHAAVLNAFKKQGWAYREVPGQEVVESSFEAHHGKIFLHVQSFAEADIVTVVGNLSQSVTASHRLRVSELIMRVNKELNLGAFEMEWDLGQVMFRQGNVFPANRADEKIIAGLVHNVVSEVDRFTPFLGEVCRTSREMLPMLDLRGLLSREDLLPPTPPEEEEQG
jgi:hypothetical protein